MVRVKSLRDHMNTYGDAVAKPEGHEYDVPEAMADTLVQVGFVALVEEGDASPLARMSKADLLALAAQEGVEHADGDTKAVLIEKIEAARG